MSELDVLPGSRRLWMLEQLKMAASVAGAVLVSEPVFGWRDRCVGGRVRCNDDDLWLRMVVEPDTRWVGGNFWTGNSDANVLNGVARPVVQRDWTWVAHDLWLHAELMTFAPGRPCSPTAELRKHPHLPSEWWRSLALAVDTVGRAHTSRVAVTQEEVADRIHALFDDRIDPTVRHWNAAHAGLHWANLFAPELVLVDWEGWGMAPAGFDAATLYLRSLLVPDVAERVHAVFCHELEGRDGLLSQLHVAGRMLLRIDEGDYPDLATPLQHNANDVIARLLALQ